MFLSRLEELRELIESACYTTSVDSFESDEALNRTQQLLRRTHEQSGVVYVVGNGGSAGIASHFATDLLRTLKIGAATLTDSNALTCFANDFGYEEVFRLQLEKILRPEDLLVAISSSGKSQNILNAVEAANAKNVSVITLSGFSAENPLRSSGEINFWLNSTDYGLVESGHFFLLHTIVDTFEQCSKKLNLYTTSALS